MQVVTNKMSKLHVMRNKKVVVSSKEDAVEVRVTNAKRKLVKSRFQSMGQALAYIQCPQNHLVPAFINGNPTIITAWSKSNGSGRKVL